ncbi:uncharacterized protein METZ01_LOCUS369166, partial [marine metagenome]
MFFIVPKTTGRHLSTGYCIRQGAHQGILRPVEIVSMASGTKSTPEHT